MSVIQNSAKSSRLPPSPPPLGHTLNPSRYTAFLPFPGSSKVEENFRHAYSIPTRLTKLKPTFFHTKEIWIQDYRGVAGKEPDFLRTFAYLNPSSSNMMPVP